MNARRASLAALGLERVAKDIDLASYLAQRAEAAAGASIDIESSAEPETSSDQASCADLRGEQLRKLEVEPGSTRGCATVGSISGSEGSDPAPETTLGVVAPGAVDSSHRPTPGANADETFEEYAARRELGTSQAIDAQADAGAVSAGHRVADVDLRAVPRDLNVPVIGGDGDAGFFGEPEVES